MKKIKFMLTVIFIFSIVGGALALKVSKRGTNVYCGNQNAIAGSAECPLVATNKTFEVTTDAVSFCQIVLGQLCTSRAKVGPARP